MAKRITRDRTAYPTHHKHADFHLRRRERRGFVLVTCLDRYQPLYADLASTIPGTSKSFRVKVLGARKTPTRKTRFLIR